MYVMDNDGWFSWSCDQHSSTGRGSVQVIDYLCLNAIMNYEGDTNLRSRAVCVSLSPSILQRWTKREKIQKRENEKKTNNNK